MISPRPTSAAALTSLLLASSFARAHPTVEQGHTSSAVESLNCTSFDAPITASAYNPDLTFLGKPGNQQELIQTFVDLNTVNSPLVAQLNNASAVLVGGTYSMHFEYCYPINVPLQPSILQLVHGVLANAGYWNVPLEGSEGTLSFVKAATEAGYATLSYDRLCVGQSDHPDGTTVCQIPYESAQAVAIAKALRDGSLGVGTWERVVGVGHSYGSGVVFTASATNPTSFDATVLTGFTLNTTASTGPIGVSGFQWTIASIADSDRWGDLADDYLITGSQSADQTGFFRYPNYSNEALELFTATKSPWAIGQVIGLFGGPPPPDGNKFAGPVLVVTAENDGPVCGGNCLVTSLGPDKTQLDTVQLGYPAVAPEDFATFVVPGDGHGINFHDNAFVAHKVITDFLLGKGL